MDIQKLITESKELPKIRNFFSGKNLPENFTVPSSLLLYCHDFPWPQTITSSRYMLIIPYVKLSYRIEDVLYPVEAGEAVLVKPFLHRSVPDIHESYLRLIVSFEADDKQPYIPDSPLMKMTEKAWAHAENLLRHYKNDEIIQSSFELTMLLFEISGNSISSGKSEKSRAVASAMLYINQYLDQSFSIKDIAAKSDISASHLRRLFRQENGISLGEYVSRRRLASAQRLLADTSMKIEEVAISCGYDSIYTFSRFFKNSTGQTPTAFRRIHKGGI